MFILHSQAQFAQARLQAFQAAQQARTAQFGGQQQQVRYMIIDKRLQKLLIRSLNKACSISCLINKFLFIGHYYCCSFYLVFIILVFITTIKLYLYLGTATGCPSPRPSPRPLPPRPSTFQVQNPGIGCLENVMKTTSFNLGSHDDVFEQST